MTTSFPLYTAPGLKTPADSKALPPGLMIGCAEMRCQSPQGGVWLVKAKVTSVRRETQAVTLKREFDISMSFEHLQPEGLSDSSRWSQRSANHRKEAIRSAVPRRGATVFCHPFRVENHFRLSSGGLRYAATTGYYLTALQAGDHSLPLQAGDHSLPLQAGDHSLPQLFIPLLAILSIR